MLTAILAEAWRAMGANKLRSFLTMLGMMIGVAAVILMLAIGQGAQYLVKQAIATMGSNLFIVLSGTSVASGVRSGSGNAPTLTLNDARAIGDLSTVADSAGLGAMTFTHDDIHQIQCATRQGCVRADSDSSR